ncbi:MAG: carbamoyltransferase N-terminal domain-containing protein [Caulobacteraceae bacterium]
MVILGLGGSNHDFSACIVENGKIVSMIEDERITRKKYGIGLGVELAKGFSRKYCLEQLNYTLDDVDMIVANDILSKTMYGRLNREVILINHHLAHAASSFYPSEFEEAAILVVDAVGSKKEINGVYNYESATFAYGMGNEIKVLDKQYGINIEGTDYIENSIGIFYSIITDIVGFGEHEEGKTMGLAPYGCEKYCDQLKKHVRFVGDGKIEMNKSDIEELLGYKEYINSFEDRDEQFKVKADFAYAGQFILEQAIFYMTEHLFKLTNCRNLCIAGGVGLNSVANYKVYKRGIYRDMFIQPASGDNGTSIGSALYGYYAILNNKRTIDDSTLLSIACSSRD